MKMTGLVLENKRKHYGVYSKYSAGVAVKLIHRKSGNIFWQAEHKLVKRGGTLPIELGTLTGIFNASKNIEAAQTGRITYEIAHQLVQTIPNLQVDRFHSEAVGLIVTKEVRKKTVLRQYMI